MNKPIDVTCLYDDTGNMIFVLVSEEKRIETLIRKGKPIEGEAGVIMIAPAQEGTGDG